MRPARWNVHGMRSLRFRGLHPGSCQPFPLRFPGSLLRVRKALRLTDPWPVRRTCLPAEPCSCSGFYLCMTRPGTLPLPSFSGLPLRFYHRMPALFSRGRSRDTVLLPGWRTSGLQPRKKPHPSLFSGPRMD